MQELVYKRGEGWVYATHLTADQLQDGDIIIAGYRYGENQHWNYTYVVGPSYTLAFWASYPADQGWTFEVKRGT